MGRAADLSDEKKKVIETHLKNPELSQRQIAQLVGVSQKSVSRIKKLLETRNSDPLVSANRRRLPNEEKSSSSSHNRTLSRRGCDLSPRKRAVIKVYLKDSSLSQRDIAKKLQISQKSVSRISRLCQTKPDLLPSRKGKCGRKRKISEQAERRIVEDVLSDRRRTSRQLTSQLNDEGLAVSSSTVRKVLKKNNLPAYRPSKKSKITPAMAKKRIEDEALNNSTTNASNRE